MSSVVITIYSHPEFYPPTLNLISELSKRFENVYVLSRNVYVSDWEYPENVHLYVNGALVPIRESERKSYFFKINSFLSYTWALLKLLSKVKPKILVLCDPIPTFSFELIRVFISRKIKLWYHNHDVIEKNEVKFPSLSWFAYHSERIIFPRLDIFTLPSLHREKYFPIRLLKGKYSYLPNYPSIYFYSNFSKAKKSFRSITLIYQGEISNDHGFEQMIPLLKYRINDKVLNLTLVGRISNDYKKSLIHIAEEFNVKDQIIFIEYVNYKKLPTITNSGQIGLAIYQKKDIMNNTIISASNKIYEYAALGLPVLLFDNEYFTNSLSQYSWCHFTNLSEVDVLEKIRYIDKNFDELSKTAIESFELKLNFEYFFSKLELN